MSREAHPAQVDKLLTIAQARCEDLNVTVRFDYRAKTAYTNGSDIVLPKVGQPITEDALDTLYGQIIHETGHHLRPEAFKILKSAKPPEHLCALFNIVEDDGMERERAEEWRGDAKALSIMNEILIRELGDTWKENANMSEENGQDPAPLACLALNQLSRLQWDTVSDVACSQFIDILPPHSKKLLTELESEGYVTKLRATKTPHDTWDLAVDLAKRLYPEEEKQDEYEEIREAGHSMAGERDDSESTFDDAQSASEDNNSGDGSGEGSAVSGTGEDGEGTDEASADQGETVSWEHCVLSEHNEWSPNNPGGPLGITWAGKDLTGGCALAPTNLINVVDLGKSKANINGSGYWRGGWQEYMPTDANSRAFANKIRRYIQAQARSVVRKDREHGKIDRGNLHRLAMPMIDNGAWNKKIFYDQRKHTMKDTAIFVLVDWSGSMMGQKMKFAADAAQRLVWCFDRVLNVPVALAAFSDRQSFCDIGYIKPYNTRGMPAEEIAKRFAKFGAYTSGNNDADSVNWAYHQILKRKETRKLLLVVSDGAPAGAWKGHAHDSLLLATRTIEKDPRVELYGLGVRDNSVQQYYTNHQVVWDEHDISPALFNMIKDGDKT
jgi:hypothetical protein